MRSGDGTGRERGIFGGVGNMHEVLLFLYSLYSGAFFFSIFYSFLFIGFLGLTGVLNWLEHPYGFVRRL